MSDIGHPKPPKVEKAPPQRIARTKRLPGRAKRIKQSNAYNDPEYRKTVEFVHKRSGNWCEYCGKAPRDGDPNHEEYAPFKGKKRVRVSASKMKDACRPCHKAYHKAEAEGRLAEWLQRITDPAN